MTNPRTRLNDATDLLREVIDLTEAAFMACKEIPDERMQASLRTLLGKTVDLGGTVLSKLEALRDQSREEAQ